MDLNLKCPDLALGPHDVLRLDDAAGTRIAARSGELWITEEGESRDFVLHAGESRIVGRDGRTLVQALVPSRVSLSEASCVAPLAA